MLGLIVTFMGASGSQASLVALPPCANGHELALWIPVIFVSTEIAQLDVELHSAQLDKHQAVAPWLGHTYPADTFHALALRYHVISVEIVYTFMLCFVVLNTACTKESNQYFGLAIGFVIAAGGFAAGWISGGAFNPAVALALDCTHLSSGFGWSLFYTFAEVRDPEFHPLRSYRVHLSLLRHSC